VRRNRRSRRLPVEVEMDILDIISKMALGFGFGI
jgi:hypothetical protein